MITKLEPNQIFVFGSNVDGITMVEQQEQLSNGAQKWATL